VFAAYFFFADFFFPDFFPDFFAAFFGFLNPVAMANLL